MVVDQRAGSREAPARTSAHRLGPSIAALWHDLSRTERLIVCALFLALCARLAARPTAPFWLDEAATGAIVSQPNFGRFWQEVDWEVSSPLYFIIMWGWQAIFGLSNVALRIPSLLFSLAAPLVILIGPLASLRRRDRLCWAALLALWIPGIGYAQDARCYALVLLLATLQTLAFIRLLEAPSLRRSALWVFFAALATAAHYDAALLALFEGLIFVGLRPRDALKCLPTGLIMLPTIALILWQWPEMARFMRPDTTWYRLFTPFDALRAALYLLGHWLWIVILPPLAIAAVVAGRGHPAETRNADAARWTAIASAAGAAVLIALAMVRPTLTMRYLAPFAPGALLLLILAMERAAQASARVFVPALVAAATTILVVWLAQGAYHTDSVIEALNYETASDTIMQAGVRHVVFTWDNPNARAMHQEQIRDFGSFFFKRAGYEAEVIPVQLGVTDDPNEQLIAAARPTHAAIIWVYDSLVKGTAASRRPPAIAQREAGWRCDDAKSGSFGVVTCLPVAARH